MREGPLAALDAIEQGDRREEGQRRSAIASAARCSSVDARLHGGRRATTASQSATLFASQVDFTYAGDLKVFVDEEQIRRWRRKMAERGYLDGSKWRPPSTCCARTT